MPRRPSWMVSERQASPARKWAINMNIRDTPRSSCTAGTGGIRGSSSPVLKFGSSKKTVPAIQRTLSCHLTTCRQCTSNRLAASASCNGMSMNSLPFEVYHFTWIRFGNNRIQERYWIDWIGWHLWSSDLLTYPSSTCRDQNICNSVSFCPIP